MLPDKISSTNPRVIDDARARQLCSDVRRCTYYETCATYGLNVNRVFNDGAHRNGSNSTAEDGSEMVPECASVLIYFTPQLLRRL